MYRRLFRVPDVIMDMTRSLEMVLIYWTTIFGHRKCSGEVSDKTGVPEGYRNPPGKYWALMGLRGERGQQPGGGAPPPMRSPIWTRGGGAAPLSLPLPLFPSPSLFLVGLGKGSPTPTRRRTPPLSLARPIGSRPPLAPLYTGAGGT